MIVIMQIQTLSLMRMKAGNSGKKYGILIKFIIEMLNGFLRPLPWKRYNNIKKKKKNSGKCFKSSLAGLPLEKMNYKDTV